MEEKGTPPTWVTRAKTIRLVRPTEPESVTETAKRNSAPSLTEDGGVMVEEDRATADTEVAEEGREGLRT
jgi:hypothetical protein